MEPAETDVRAAIAQQGAWLGAHETKLSTTSSDVERLSARLLELNAQMEQLCRPSEPEPHANNPPTYDGDPDSCRSFLSQCSLVFSLQPRRYASEESRIAFVIILLTGRAREWATAVWDARAPCSRRFMDFKAEMLKLFDRSVQGDARPPVWCVSPRGVDRLLILQLSFRP